MTNAYRHAAALAALIMASPRAIAENPIEVLPRNIVMPDYWPAPRREYSRSKYTPHIGAKERARHAGKPDGPMHVTGWERRAA